MKNKKIEDTWTIYHKELRRFALSKLHDKDACADILQEVFIKFYTLSTTIDPGHVKQWLYQVTRNMINDYYRKPKHSPNVEQVELPDHPNESNVNERFAKCMYSFVHKLPAKYKEAITLVEFDKLDQLQLAKRLNISYSGAKSRVQRGRELLKTLFLQCCNVSTDKYGNIIEHKTKSRCNTCNI